MDDLEVVLSDGTKQMLKAMVDQRTALGILQAVDADRNNIGYVGDLSRGHMSLAVESMCRRHGIEPVAVPGEAWKQKGVVEKRIDFYKDHFVE
eukprot:103613-Karenia_brevis.AAC.1